MNNNDLKRFYGFNEEIIEKKDFVRIGKNGKISRDILPYRAGDVDDELSLESVNPVENKVITQALNEKQDNLTFDDFPTENSNNPVKSGGIYSTIKNLSANDVDALPNTTKYGAGLEYQNNSLQLKDQNGDDLGDPVTITGGGSGPAEIIVDTVGDGNAITSVNYDSQTGEMTFTKGENFVKTSDVDNTLDTSSENPVQNKVIAELIPSQASSSNQLADKDFVNSSIATNTANFIGTFNNVTALNNYVGTVTNNDYANVINQELDFQDTTAMNTYNKTLLTNYDYGWVVNGTKYDLYRFDIDTQTWGLRATSINKGDVSLIVAYNRYKYNATNQEWMWDYTVNTSGFTAAQWAAINSGLTVDDKTKLNGIESGAQVNDIESISLNNTTITPDANKNINIDTTDKVDKTTTPKQIYGTDNNGDQTTYTVSQSANGGSIAQRDSGGRLDVGTPTGDSNATTKLYVDTTIITKVSALSGALAPSNTTAADFVGQTYINTTNSDVYQCINKVAQGTDPETYLYIWKKLDSSPAIDNTTIVKNSSNELEARGITNGTTPLSYNTIYDAITTTWEV